MCDFNEEQQAAEKEMKKDARKPLGNSLCMKCKETKPVVMVRVNDPMCWACFLVYATHKFRSTLGKSKLIRANDKVLLAVSGGQSSMAMLDFVKEALSEGAHKRLKFSPAVIFVDESLFLDTVATPNSSNVKSTAEKFGYEFFQVPICQTTDNNKDQSKELRKKFNAIESLTAKIDFVTSLRLHTIVDVATKHGFSKVMIGENATTLSIKLLCNVSQGRGAMIPKDISVGDDRYPGVTVVRPMREFSSKEVALYNRLSNIDIQSTINLRTMKDASSSLQRQTEEFILGLQVDFPSTVNTVFRTGEKLCASDRVTNTEDNCAFCRGVITNDDAVNGGREVDACGKSNCCGSSDECSSNKFRLTVSDVQAHMCYGCNLTFRDMRSAVIEICIQKNYDLECLPAYILDTISTTMKRKRMKESIQDFLLE